MLSACLSERCACIFPPFSTAPQQQPPVRFQVARGGCHHRGGRWRWPLSPPYALALPAVVSLVLGTGGTPERFGVLNSTAMFFCSHPTATSQRDTCSLRRANPSPSSSSSAPVRILRSQLGLSARRAVAWPQEDLMLLVLTRCCARRLGRAERGARAGHEQVRRHDRVSAQLFSLHPASSLGHRGHARTQSVR